MRTRNNRLELDRRIEAYLHERERSWNKEPLLEAPANIGVVIEGTWQEFKREPGRQDAFRNRNVRTFQSYHAAMLIYEEMKYYRAAFGVARVPKPFRDKLWAAVSRLYPAADESIVWDHIRLNRRQRW
ncbi:hypothetical protein IVB12_36025 [Bradyrhizobium sp. 179]|uniref:hypothetical protein n=1 Tax=Bradyrhizobium sp. 179 TaxID=2782648 RepID=UPI001FF8CF72|nr:hypothetical protein [Bradyrhizobium sp. 179]MCK1547190.1 hypothetical protein [Bradyrhizobium sp. 179]